MRRNDYYIMKLEIDLKMRDDFEIYYDDLRYKILKDTENDIYILTYNDNFIEGFNSLKKCLLYMFEDDLNRKDWKTRIIIKNK